MAAPVHRLTKVHGLDSESLKKFFDHKTIMERPGAKRLVDEIQNRIHAGINRNQRDFRLYKAMDWAYDLPFFQVSATQLKYLLDKQPDDKKVYETLNNWGLTHLLQDEVDSNGVCCTNADGSKKKVINLPVFFNVFVPVCMSYVTVRWAKLFNDRNQYPHYKYEPAQYTLEDRLRCEIITQIVQKMSSWFDYPSDTKQTILQTLMYGLCVNFPKEAWYCEKQENEDGGVSIVREGVRFEMPHPNRMYADPYYRLSTANSNSGVEFMGHWEIARYRDIHDNKKFWNTDCISMGSVGWFGSFGDFLEQVMPCAIQWPTSTGTGSSLDRQSEIQNFYDYKGDADASTLKTTHFQRLIPKDYGMGTYEYPVWFRFIIASDAPVLYAEPLAYDVMPTYAYDADFNRSRFRSLTLEIMPFQDAIGNALSHWILALKQNLMNPIFVDSSKVSKEDLTALKNAGAKQFSGNLFLSFSSPENRKFQDDQKEAFLQPILTRHNTAEISALISGILSILDRVMQVSPQEVGQAASHEQTAEETRIIDKNMSTRVSFTGTFIDSGDTAKKKLLYDAVMAYADDDIIVGISSSFVDTEEELKAAAKKLGLEWLDQEKNEGEMTDPAKSLKNPQNARRIKVKKKALQLEQFASTRPAEDRVNSAAIAEAMSKVYTAVANQPLLIQSVGTQQMIEFLNQISIVAGLPREFRLRGKAVDPSQAPEEQAKQLQQVLTDMAEKVRTLVEQKQQETIKVTTDQTQAMIQKAVEQIAQAIQPLSQAAQQATQVNAAQQEQIEQLATGIQHITGIVASINQQVNPPQPPPLQPAPSFLMPGTIPGPMGGPIMAPEVPAAPVGAPM